MRKSYNCCKIAFALIDHVAGVIGELTNRGARQPCSSSDVYGRTTKRRRAGLKGYGFTLIDGVELVDKTQRRMEQTILRIRFSDPSSRQLLARRVVSRRKDLLKMRSELAFVLRLYLEPILLGRGTEKDHSVGLLNLIKVLNLPAAGWHKYKGRRQTIFSKAIKELCEMKTTDGHRIDVLMRQGSNPSDSMLVGRLVPMNV